MHPVNIFLCLSIFLITKSMDGQEISMEEAKSYAEKLTQKNILTKKGKAFLLKQLVEGKIEGEHPSTVKAISYTFTDVSRQSILEFCSRAFSSAQTYRIFKKTGVEEKITPEDTMISRTFFRFGPLGGSYYSADYIDKSRSAIGLTRTRTLRDFLAIGLIDKQVYDKCVNGLSDSSIIDEPQLLASMTRESIYYRFYEFNKKEQVEYIDTLTKMGLLTPKAREQLLNSYAPDELKTIPQMLEYSDRYLFVDLRSFEPKPNITYPVIFEQIKTLLPTFQYQDLKIETLKQKEYDLTREDIKLSFTVGETHYANVFFHDYKKEDQDSIIKERAPSRVDEDFHKGVNKWLTNIESPYRLYTINIREKNQEYFGGQQVGLLLLKNGEAGKISTNVYFMSEETFDQRLSQKNISKLIDDFSAHSFFNHLTQAEIDSAKEQINVSDIGSLEEALIKFPKTIVLFDWETGNLENPYEDLTKRFADASRGLLAIDEITDDYKRGWNHADSIKYGFKVKGKQYAKMLVFKQDWLDPDFLEMIRSAIKENGIDGDIYYCIDNGQESGYIFLSALQHKFILENYPDLLKGIPGQ